eukprot:g72981.t1
MPSDSEERSTRAEQHHESEPERGPEANGLAHKKNETEGSQEEDEGTKEEDDQATSSRDRDRERRKRDRDRDRDKDERPTTDKQDSDAEREANQDDGKGEDGDTKSSKKKKRSRSKSKRKKRSRSKSASRGRDRDRDRDRYHRDRDTGRDRDRDRHRRGVRYHGGSRHGARFRDWRRSRSRSRGRRDRRHRRSRSRSSSSDSSSDSEPEAKTTAAAQPPAEEKKEEPTPVISEASQEGANAMAQVQAMMQRMQQKQLHAANRQLTRGARRIYIGNLPTTLPFTGPLLIEYFSDVLKKLGLPLERPIIDIQFTAPNKFCFLELRSVPDTVLALPLLQNVSIFGQLCRADKPKDYSPAPPHLNGYVIPLDALDPPSAVGAANPAIAAILQARGLPAAAQANPMLLALLGLPAGAAAEPQGTNLVTMQALQANTTVASQPLSLFSELSAIAAKQTVPAPAAEVGSGSAPLLSLPGIALPTPSTSDTVITTASSSLLPSTALLSSSPAPAPAPAPVVPVNVQPQPVSDTKGMATRVVCLVNMVSAKDLVSDEDYEDTKLDVTEEAEKHGKVIKVVVPRPANLTPGCEATKEDLERGVERIFIEFEETASATKSRDMMQGRRFNGRQIRATYYDETLFAQEKYNARLI